MTVIARRTLRLTLPLLVAGIVWQLWPAPRGSGINGQSFDRIRKGMTEAEVEEVFGCPSGHYNSRPVLLFMSGTSFRRWWVTNEAVITIELSPEGDDAFGKPGTVAQKFYEPLPPEALSARLRRLLRWRWP